MHTLYLRAFLKCLFLAQGLCSEARGSVFSNTPIYLMTSPQRRFNFIHAWLGGFQLGRERSGCREVTLKAQSWTTLFFLQQNRQAWTFSHLSNSTDFACQMIPVDLNKTSLTTGKNGFTFCLALEDDVIVCVRKPSIWKCLNVCTRIVVTFLQIGNSFSDIRHADVKFFKMVGKWLNEKMLMLINKCLCRNSFLVFPRGL